MIGDERAVADQIRGGLDACEFEPFFQPIVNIADSSLVGFEALARWRRPGLGLVSPAEFVASAEASGLIRALDSAILDQAWRVFDAALDDHPPRDGKPLLLSVNLSADHLFDHVIVDHVATLIAEGRGLRSRLQLEITETLHIRDAATALDVLNSLKSLGVSMALDDFGTGYSSLVYLHRFPIDCIKIDRSFLETVVTSERSQVIVGSIVALSQSMGMRAVAEGVERREVADALLVLGCQFGQGLYFGAPVPADELPTLLKNSIISGI
jgi:EAL domain-containing protein (putative c-di-GMP-specific phosphodiesterase class I)